MPPLQLICFPNFFSCMHRMIKNDSTGVKPTKWLKTSTVMGSMLSLVGAKGGAHEDKRDPVLASRGTEFWVEEGRQTSLIKTPRQISIAATVEIVRNEGAGDNKENLQDGSKIFPGTSLEQRCAEHHQFHMPGRWKHHHQLWQMCDREPQSIRASRLSCEKV